MMFISKNIIFFRVIVLLVLAAFSGCVTSKIEYVESDKVPVEKVYRISQLYLKDGTIIDVKEKEAKLRLKYKGISNVIVYYEDVNMERAVLLKDITHLKIEIIESNQLVTALIIIGSVAAVLLIAFFIAIGIVGLEMH